MRQITAILIVLLCSAGSWAAPAEISRVVRTFDFEERRLGNTEDLPMNWTKKEGENLPHYVNGHLSKEQAHGGEYSFQFDLNGGGLVYTYGPGQLPVQAGAHYRIEGFCKTTLLPNARARISAYFTDQDGHPLANTVRHSELYAARSADSGWEKLHVEMEADAPQDAWLVLELELLQPVHYAGSSLGKRTLQLQDIIGTAWFDDVTISQVPDVALSTLRPGNIFRKGDAAQLQVTIADSFTQDLVAHLAIKDADDKQVYQRNGALDLTAAEPGDPSHRKSIVRLPELPPGWYQVSLSMTSQGRLLGSRSLDLVLLPDNGASYATDQRFGINATQLPFDGWSELPAVLPILSAGRVKLAVWSSTGDVEQDNPAAFDSVLDKLQRLGITPTACLLDVPPSISGQWGGKSWEKLLTADPNEWRPHLAYLVSRHANQLDRWQLGNDGSDIFVRDPKMRKVYARIYREISPLVHNPDLAMPWPAWYEFDGELPATVALWIPSAILPQQLPTYMQDVRKHEGHNLSLAFESLDRSRYGRQVQIRDLAQRVIYALSADATRIDFPLPFTVRRESGQLIKQPHELVMIVRTLSTTLGGASYKGKVPLGEGIESFLFDRDGHGILALWDRGDTAGIKQLSINLGKQPAMIDLWGNVTPLLRGPGEMAAGKVRVTVGPMPIFLVDIDGPQAQLRASVAIDPPLLESSLQPHQRKIRFINTYPQGVTGTLRLKGPAGWTVTPGTVNFALSAGEKFERELTISLPYNSVAGTKIISCDFSIQNEETSLFTVPIEMRFGLSDVGIQSIALRDGKDVVIQQMITNYGDKPINYNAFALFPGESKKYGLVKDLGPGQSIAKRYRFINVKVPAGTHVRVGVQEQDGPRIFNEEIPVQ